jgi:tRNA A-37 threonylcarbamoyl transferase component Bud32
MSSNPIGRRIPGPQGEPHIIEGFVGRGAFGEVYRARGESTRTVIAVKLLPIGRLADDAQRRALLNEIRAAQAVNHPNVVRVLFVDEGSAAGLGPYVCMEYVSGGTLDGFLRTRAKAATQLSLARAVEMMVDIAEGARAVNEKLVHRDIKPDNILIEGEALKIGDFGISKFVDESTRLHTFKGIQHVAYKAPEGWTNEKNTYKLDVYSVGLIFFEILTLRHPLSAKVRDVGNASDWEKAHLFEPCPDPRGLRGDVPISLAQLILRMAAKRPQDRPDWIEALGVLGGSLAGPVPSGHPAISEAVASAVARQRELEKKNLESEREAREDERRLLLYQHSCEALQARLQVIVAQFDQEFQLGKIGVTKHWAATSYALPGGDAIEVSFFQPIANGIKITAGIVIGGGWIGLRSGRSANLVLLRESADDLYGRWAVCEVKLMALVSPRAIVGRFGLTPQTVEPFGFKDAFFYEQIRYATGIAHAFTYHFTHSVEDYFAALIAEGCR